MTASIPTSTLEKFTTFGDLLRYLRRHAGLTQLELSIAVGYSDAQISRLEQNQRPPDLPTVAARFPKALGLEDEPEAVARLLDLAANVHREDAPSFGVCPYKGLNYFDENDGDIFIGREALTDRLLERVTPLPAGKAGSRGRFLAVVGASGSGKSSLVRAGLVPALHWNKQSAAWRVQILTPTARPLESLAQSLAGEGGSVTATAALIDDLAREPRSLHLYATRELKSARGSRLVLVVDQFEELFALCRSEEERAAFVDNLLTAAFAADGPVIVVITLRADFYAHCAAYPDLREALAGQQEYIGAMSEGELRRAIVEPAERGRWELEPGLVEQLLHDVGSEPGGLPLLSHALLETWQRRRGRTMTLGGYASSGGVRAAIAETAEAVFTDQFSHEQQAIARRVFLRLTELGEETSTGDTRRRATFEELVLKPEETDATRAVLTALADARLITISEDAAEVAHEALIREWPTLRGWLEDNREGLRLHRQLTEAAQEWATMDRDPDVLYRGTRLAQALEWREAHEADLNAGEKEFLAASLEASQREAEEREAQRQRELEAAQKLAETERRSASRLRRRAYLLAGAFALAILLAGVAAFFGNSANRSAAAAQESALTAQENEDAANESAISAQNAQATAQSNESAALDAQAIAQAERDRADAQRLAAEGSNLLQNSSRDANLIALLAIRSLDETYTPAGDVLLNHVTDLPLPPQEFRGHTGVMWGVDISPDGKYLATGGEDNTARLWDSASGESLRTFVGHTDEVGQVKFSPDGKYLATTSVDGTDRLWDVATGETVREFTGCPRAGGSVEFSPDGKYLLSPCWDTPTLIWDVATGQTVHALARADGPDFVPRATYSADGKYVATEGVGGDENATPTARVYDAATGNEVAALALPAPAASLALSPDGQYLAIGDESGRIWLWDISSGEMVREYVGHSQFIQAIRFSADGRYLLSGSNDTTARLWDVASGETIRTFGGHGGEVRDVAISRDGSLVATAGDDRIARVWSLRASPIGVQFAGPLGIARQASFSPDGKRIVTANADGNARIWDTTTGQLLLTLAGHTDEVRGAVFSPDGEWVLTGSADGTARLWDAASGEELRSFEGHTDWVNRAIFSPDARQVVTSSNDGSARAWDTDTGQPIWVYRPPAGASRVTSSPDGKTVAVASRGPSTSILDFVTGERLMVFHLAGEIMTDVSFSPDGNYLCAFSTGYFLWDVRTGQQVQPADDAPACGEFSADGRYFATIHPDNSVRIWDTQSREEMRRFANPSDVYKVAFSPDGKYILAADGDGTARMWLIDLDEAISAQCAALTRDFTPEEREQYEIRDGEPTCPESP
jgi:WD40 repeat protein